MRVQIGRVTRKNIEHITVSLNVPNDELYLTGHGLSLFRPDHLELTYEDGRLSWVLLAGPTVSIMGATPPDGHRGSLVVSDGHEGPSWLPDVIASITDAEMGEF